ncbi:MAG: sugar transferase [Bacillota bacterium]
MLYRKIIKRVIDKLVAFCALVLFVPFYIAIAAALKIDSEGPVLFKQERVGYRKKTFKVYKFRTMRTDAPKYSPTRDLGNPHLYITKVGGFLRRTSLDEFPQLLNVLKGEMSIIGPRPVVWNETDLICERDKRRVYEKVYPGITGLAQIRGRDAVGVKQKARYDAIYADKISFGADLFIFWKTIVSVLKKEGIFEGDSVETSVRNLRVIYNEKKTGCTRTEPDETAYENKASDRASL